MTPGDTKTLREQVEREINAEIDAAHPILNFAAFLKEKLVSARLRIAEMEAGREKELREAIEWGVRTHIMGKRTSEDFDKSFDLFLSGPAEGRGEGE